MSTNINKKPKGSSSVQSQVMDSLKTIISLAIYLFLGLYLCYMKILFGDLSRSDVSHDEFTTKAYPVEMRTTTPSVPYYCYEDKTEYVKQLFVKNPNFITEFAQNSLHYNPEKLNHRILKLFFLETSYVVFSMVSILEDIPNWIIMFIGPFIWGLLIFSIFICNWISISYNIFIYFSQWNYGWILGFIIWLYAMVFCFLGFIPVISSTIYGLGRLFALLARQNVRVLNPSSESSPQISEENSSPYGFFKFWTDMTKSSTSVHLILLYGLYKIIGHFNSLVSTSFIVLALIGSIILIVVYRRYISFIPKENLNAQGWTSNYVESINLNSLGAGSGSGYDDNLMKQSEVAVAEPITENAPQQQYLSDKGKVVANANQSSSQNLI
jgi:hypothetical protein